MKFRGRREAKIEEPTEQMDFRNELSGRWCLEAFIGILWTAEYIYIG